MADTMRPIMWQWGTHVIPLDELRPIEATPDPLSREIVWTDTAPVSREWALADRATVTSAPLAAT